MATLGVKSGVQPKLVEMLAILANVVATVDAVTTVTITSAMDGVHGPRSFHYALRAIDLRTKNFPSRSATLAFVDQLRAAFGSEYDILYEAVGTPNEHIHIEWDPR